MDLSQWDASIGGGVRALPFIGLATTIPFTGHLRRLVAIRRWPMRGGIMGSIKTMLFGILILLLGLGVITTTIPLAAGTPVSFLFGSLSSTTLRIIDYCGYALILLGLIIGLIGSFQKSRGSTVNWNRKLE